MPVRSLHKSSINPLQWTFKGFHKKIYGTKNKTYAAANLGIHVTELNNLLLQIKVTYIMLRDVDPLSGEGVWGDWYKDTVNLGTIIQNISSRSSRRLTDEKILTNTNLLSVQNNLKLQERGDRIVQQPPNIGQLSNMPMFEELSDENDEPQQVETHTDLSKLTIRDIHLIIINARHEKGAAELLQVEHQTLQRYLALRGLNFDMLMKMETPEKAQQELGDIYNSLIVIPKSDLAEETFRYIHRKILNAPYTTTPNSSAAAAALGTNYTRLNQYLHKRGTSFDVLSKITIGDAAARFKLYDSPLKKSKMDSLLKLSLCQIHEEIINQNHVNKERKLFGISLDKLEEHLIDRGVSYEILLNMSTEKAEKEFDSIYNDIPVWKEDVPLSKLTLTNILKEIPNVSCLYSLAKCLEVHPEKFKRGLKNLGYDFHILKKGICNDQHLASVEKMINLNQANAISKDSFFDFKENAGEMLESFDNKNPYRKSLIDKFSKLLGLKKQALINQMWLEHGVQDAVAELDDEELYPLAIKALDSSQQTYRSSTFIESFFKKIERRDILEKCLVYLKSRKVKDPNVHLKDKRITTIQKQIDRLFPPVAEVSIKQHKTDIEPRVLRPKKKRIVSNSLIPQKPLEADIETHLLSINKKSSSASVENKKESLCFKRMPSSFSSNPYILFEEREKKEENDIDIFFYPKLNANGALE